MTSTLTLRDRLPSAAAALAVQAGLLALLLLSFEAVRQVVEEKETILTLPPLAKAPPRPVTIDARGMPRAAARPAAPKAAAPYAQPAFEVAAPQAGVTLQGPARGGDDCRDAKGGCRPAAGAAGAPPALPEVKHPAYWEAERAAAKIPPRVPCVSFFSVEVGMNAFQRKDTGVMTDPLCIIRHLRGGDEDGGPQYDAPPADPAAGHASDVAFKQALAAVQTRQRTLFGKTAPAPAPAGAAP